MAMEALLISFLYLCLKIAVIIIIALAIVWLCKLFGFPIDDQIYKVGKIIVLILCLIAVALWLFGLSGIGWLGYRLAPINR